MKIIINSKEHTFTTNPGHPYYKIGYESLVEMAGLNPFRDLTVTWHHKNYQGSLTRGREWIIEEGMIVNVVDTSNA